VAEQSLKAAEDSLTMRIYYLEESLPDGDLQFVADALGLDSLPEQVRIPYVLPLLAAETDYVAASVRHEALLRTHLRRAGIGRDQGSQVAFVAPRDMHWYSVIIRAIAAETGFYPYLVQTAAQRAAIGNPGEVRLLDTEGLIGGNL